MRIRGRHNTLVEQKLAVARLHSLDDAAQDRLADGVWPAVEDGVHEVRTSALDGLGVVEIVLNPDDVAVELPGLFHDLGQVLEDELAGMIGEGLLEVKQVVSDTTGNVNQERRFGARLCAVDEALLHGIYSRIDPAHTALSVSAHVVVEVIAIPDGVKVAEHVQIGVVCPLERSVVGISDILELVFQGELVKFVWSSAGASTPIVSSLLASHVVLMVALVGDTHRAMWLDPITSSAMALVKVVVLYSLGPVSVR